MIRRRHRMGSACADFTRCRAFFLHQSLYVAVFPAIWGLIATSPQNGDSGASGTGPRVHAASPHLGQAGDGGSGAGAAILDRARWPTDDQTAGGRQAARAPATRSCRRSAGAFSGARTYPPACGGWSGWRRRRSGRSPKNSPPRRTRRKPASSIVPWPGTSSFPVVGSVASTPPAGSSARCRARARASRSSTTSTSCSTRRSCPRRRPACWSRVTSSLRCGTCSTRRICAWESWSRATRRGAR